MGLNARKIQHTGGTGGSSQEPIEAGTYPVRIVQVIDLGVQKQNPYQGKEKPPIQMIGLTYEFVDEFCLDEDGNEDLEKPRWLSEQIPLHSLEADKAKSTNRYNAFDPDETHGGDFTALVGAPANLTVVHNNKGDKTYVNVQGASVMRARDAKKTADLVNEPKVFILDEPDLAIFQSFPEWIQTKIKGNLEYQGSALQKALDGAPVDSQEEPEDNSDDGDGDGW